MSQTQSDPSQTTSPAPPADDDPLSHLHKMSTTAGLGSGDYVAVNGAAVFALLLGLASALALLEDLLLIIPLAGIVIAVIAWRQIQQSNGTQTGRGLVIIGLVLMLGFGGYVFAQNVTASMRTRDDRRAISELITQLSDTVKSGNYADGYKLFSDRFKQSVSPKQFTDQIKNLNESEVYGKLRDARSGLMQFQADEATGARFAIVRMTMDFEKAQRPLADDLVVRKEQDQWRIESFPLLFGSGNREQPQQAQ